MYEQRIPINAEKNEADGNRVRSDLCDDMYSGGCLSDYTMGIIQIVNDLLCGMEECMKGICLEKKQFDQLTKPKPTESTDLLTDELSITEKEK